ncbi:hypothetical protein EPN44_11685 [bacterium]|nr:MAG: hypothetical protein EPN44_11685 [bacterium]
MELLVIKVGLPTLLIGAASLAGRRWGSTVGGWLVGLPLTSGPIILLLTLEYGNAFAARAAHGIVLGLISTAAFAVTYALAARRSSWPWCWALSWAAFAACTAILNVITFSLAGSFLAALAALALALPLLPASEAPAAGVVAPSWETPLRMLAAAAIVVTLTGVAGGLGPRLSGLITPMPVAGTIMTVFTHRLEGAPSSVRLLRGFIAGNFAFAAFFLVVATRLVDWGLVPTFGVAVLAACVVQGAALLLLRLQPRGAA